MHKEGIKKLARLNKHNCQQYLNDIGKKRTEIKLKIKKTDFG